MSSVCHVICLLCLTAISHRMIERIFSGAVTRYCLLFVMAFLTGCFRCFVSAVVHFILMFRGRKVHKEGRLSYGDFVWFLISEEDKKTETR